MEVSVWVIVTVRGGGHASAAAVSLVRRSSDVAERVWTTPVGSRLIVELSPSRAVVVAMNEPGEESSDAAGGAGAD